jgi:hypothetical protein
MREKIPFLFSPPYQVPRITATFFSMLKATATSEFRLCCGERERVALVIYAN